MIHCIFDLSLIDEKKTAFFFTKSKLSSKTFFANKESMQIAINTLKILNLLTTFYCTSNVIAEDLRQHNVPNLDSL